MPEIRITGLCKSYRPGTSALHPCDLTIAHGEYFVLVGPSGSGKSTLLRMVAGLEPPTGGSVHLGGIDATSLAPHERGISFVPQQTAIYPHLTVAENLTIGLRLADRHRPRGERTAGNDLVQRLHATAEMLGISELLDRAAVEISGGEQRRVVIGRAILRGTRIWLLDEPFTHLDPAISSKLSADVLLLRRELDLTIIHVTHDPIEATATADRIGVLGGGCFLQIGSPDEVNAQPSNRTVALFFGSPSVNLLRGSGDGREFTAVGERWRTPCPHFGSIGLGFRPTAVTAEPRTGWMELPRFDSIDCRQSTDGRYGVVGRWGTQEIHGVVDRPIGPLQVLFLDPTAVWWFDETDGRRIG